MTNATLIIWCNAMLPAEAKDALRAGIGEHKIVFADESSTSSAQTGSNLIIAAGGLPAEANIVFGQPDPEEVMRSERLRWVHLNSAGYTRYDRPDFRAALEGRGAVMTNSSHVYAEPTAQHLLAMILALARLLPASLDAQRTTRAWNYFTFRSASRLLNHQSALVLSFGHIARRFIELLAPFEMDITAVRRHVRGDERVRVVAETEVEHWLPKVDHVVNILPGSPSTNNFLSAERLALTKKGAILYNIGRGTTLDQNALIENLQSGRLAAAYLDVMDPEPLPPEHPLWTTPNCYITPHTAGGHIDEMERLVDHFLENFRRFVKGSELLDRVV